MVSYVPPSSSVNIFLPCWENHCPQNGMEMALISTRWGHQLDRLTPPDGDLELHYTIEVTSTICLNQTGCALKHLGRHSLLSGGSTSFKVLYLTVFPWAELPGLILLPFRWGSVPITMITPGLPLDVQCTFWYVCRPTPHVLRPSCLISCVIGWPELWTFSWGLPGLDNPRITIGCSVHIVVRLHILV